MDSKRSHQSEKQRGACSLRSISWLKIKRLSTDKENVRAGHNKKIRNALVMGQGLIYSLFLMLGGSKLLGDESPLPHANDPVKQAEHIALFNLVKPETATHQAIRSGPWNQATTWANERIPGDESRVLIPRGMVVTLSSQEKSRIHWIRIDGTFRFDPSVNTELKVDTVVVDGKGRLEIGTEAMPIEDSKVARMIFTDRGSIDGDWDPLMLSRGLISHGSVSMFGKKKSGYVGLSSAPSKGSFQLQLAQPLLGVGVGDRLLLPGVHKRKVDWKNNDISGTDENEIVKVKSVSPDGKVIQLASPLVFDHLPPRSDLQIPVASLDRNILLESENTEDPRRAGHVMLMHSADVALSYAAFRHIGRNNKLAITTDVAVDGNGKQVPGTGNNPRGRYAVHFHRSGISSSPIPVRGCVVENNPGWGYVNHDSHVEFEDNVAFNVAGAGFVTEIGNEQGSFIHNIAVRSRGSIVSAIDPSDHPNTGTGLGSMGHGFWMQSPAVSLIDNVASDHGMEGIFLHNFNLSEPGRTQLVQFPMEYVPDGVTMRSEQLRGATVAPAAVPFAKISGNVVFASGIGWGVRWHRRPKAPTSGLGGDVIENFRIWNVTYSGVRLGYTAGLIFRNGTILGNLDQPLVLSSLELKDPIFRANSSDGKGFISNVNSQNLRLENVDIEGFAVGIQVQSNGDTVIDGARLRNIENIRVTTPQSTREFGERGRRVYATSVTSLPLPGYPQYEVKMLKQLRRLPRAGGTLPVDEFFAFTDQDEIYYNGVRLYYYDQAVSGVPFGGTEVPPFMKNDDSDFERFKDKPTFPAMMAEAKAANYPKYLDLTQQQLFETFHLALGGAIAPSSAYDGQSKGIYGLVEENVTLPRSKPPVVISITNPQERGTVLSHLEKACLLEWVTEGLMPNTQWMLKLISKSDGKEYVIGDSLYQNIMGPVTVTPDPNDSLGRHQWSSHYKEVGLGGVFGKRVDIPAGSFVLKVEMRKGKYASFQPSVGLCEGTCEVHEDGMIHVH